MTSQLLRREHAIERAQHERDALLQMIADASEGLNPATRHALEHHTHLLHDAVHLVVTMGDEPVYPCALPGKERP